MNSLKKAKSIQFLSFAECIDEYRPDIVAFDANEPDKDYYTVDGMKFFDNLNKGKGARTFFDTLNQAGLNDAFSIDYETSNYVEGEPLAVSHKLSRGNKAKRYDFVFVNNKIKVDEIDYKYDVATMAGSDHALIEMSVKIERGL